MGLIPQWIISWTTVSELASLEHLRWTPYPVKKDERGKNYKDAENRIWFAIVWLFCKYNSDILKFGIPPRLFWNFSQRLFMLITGCGTPTSVALVWAPCLKERNTEKLSWMFTSLLINSGSCVRTCWSLEFIFQLWIAHPCSSHIAGPHSNALPSLAKILANLSKACHISNPLDDLFANRIKLLRSPVSPLKRSIMGTPICGCFGCWRPFLIPLISSEASINMTSLPHIAPAYIPIIAAACTIACRNSLIVLFIQRIFFGICIFFWNGCTDRQKYAEKYAEFWVGMGTALSILHRF